MTTPQQLIVPTPEQIENTAKRVDYLWEVLVPRSAKPLHKQVKEDIDEVLRLVHRFLATRGVQVQTAVATAAAQMPRADAADGDGDAEASPLPAIMRMLRTLDPEQVLQVRILLMLHDERMTDEGRLEIFEELEFSHHLDCGVQVYADEQHDCPLREGREGEDEEDEREEDEEDGRAADDDGGPRDDSSRVAPAMLPLEVLNSPPSPSPPSEDPR